MSAVEPHHKSRLQACERVLSESVETYVKVGLSLKAIRDNCLYKEDGIDQFYDYCKKWDMTKRRVDQLISAAELRITLFGYTPK